MSNLALRQWQQGKQPKNLMVERYDLSKANILQIVNDAIKEDRIKTVNRLYAVFALTLHDMHGFKKKRLQRVLAKTASHFDCVMQGYVTEKQIMDEVAKFDIFIK